MTLWRTTLITLAAVAFVTGSHSAPAPAAPEATNQGERVTVTMMRGSCEYFIVETDRGLCIFEWYGGGVPVEGDILRGELDSYGFQNAYNVTQNCEIKVFVEDYWLGSMEATEELYELCD
jgi:hypothetical protein